MRASVVLGSVFSTLSQEIGFEKRLRNDLFCVDWDEKTATISIDRSITDITDSCHELSNHAVPPSVGSPSPVLPVLDQRDLVVGGDQAEHHLHQVHNESLELGTAVDATQKRIGLKVQEAQLSPRDRAMRRVS